MEGTCSGSTLTSTLSSSDFAESTTLLMITGKLFLTKMRTSSDLSTAVTGFSGFTMSRSGDRYTLLQRWAYAAER